MNEGKAVLLEISHFEDSYRFRLEQPEPATAVRQFTTPPISRSDQQRLHQAIGQATQRGRAPFSLTELGRLMFNLLLPPEIQIFLRELDRPLLLSTDAPEMPWELFFDDTREQFLGCWCALGRRLITEAELHHSPPPSGGQTSGYLLIGDPRGNLAGASAEVEQLEQLIVEAGLTPRTLRGSRADQLTVQVELQRGEQYLGLHYAGHADFDRPARQPALLLAGRTRLTADAIRRLLRGEPLVFLNACGTDRAGPRGPRANQAWQATEALAAAFIAGGAKGVVGTRWEVADAGAAAFALLFYTAALRGVPLGEALRQARERFRAERPDDPTWAAFALYGDPCQTLLTTASEPAPPRLDPTRFDPVVRQWLQLLPTETQLVGQGQIDLPHFFIALTKIEDASLPGTLRRLGASPSRLRNRLRRLIFQGAAAAEPPPLERASFTDAAWSILEQVEAGASPSGAPANDRELSLALLARADPTIRSCLQEVGLTPEQLMAALRGEAVVVPTSRGEPSRPGQAEREQGLTEEARRLLRQAREVAAQHRSPTVETPHLLISMLMAADGVTAQALREQSIAPDRLAAALRSALGGQPSGTAPAVAPDLPVSARVREILGLARAAAAAEAAPRAGERHLLIGFLEVRGSATAALLQRAGLDFDVLLARVRAGRPGPATAGQSGGAPTPLLDRLGRDLTAEARAGRLRPIIGRGPELARLAQVLARSEKSSPLLVGEAGVGKTAIVEGLAQRIAMGQVPPHLIGRRLIELPVASLVGGTRFRGDLEERLGALIKEANQPEIIVFIDEIHTLVGAGRSSGALDAANIMKPALARGELRCIGATTPSELRHSILNDPALERRFQPITVAEPSAEQTLELLRQTRERYERHHGVRLLDEAIEAAVELSIRYLPDRRLPDKAADLVDEACVRVRVGSPSQWPIQEGPAAPPVPIDAQAVARVVADWTGVPVGRLTDAEQTHLLQLEELLRQRVVGQDEAVTSVAEAVRLGRAGLKRPNQPVGVFLFVGPTGVGKTELARALAAALFGADSALTRLDMSEFMEAHSVSGLIGPPPGFIGYGQDGQLTGALQRQPYAVVLLDEIEKAHPRVFDLFLQLFDAGRLTDTQGRLADGRNAIFILTSNLASEVLEKHQQTLGFQSRPTSSEELRHEVIQQLRRTFRPEFLNRIDEIILFRHLAGPQLQAIAELRLTELRARLAEQHALVLEVEPGVVDLLRRTSDDPHGLAGARPLLRAIEQRIERPLSRLILQGTRGRLVLRVVGDQLEFGPNSPEAEH